MKQESKKSFEIPVEGCLALLAEGAKGIIAWKKKKAAVQQKSLQGEK